MTIQYARGNRGQRIYLINPRQHTLQLPSFEDFARPSRLGLDSTSQSALVDSIPFASTSGTEIEQRTTVARWMVLRTSPLAVNLDQRVVLIQHLRRPLRRCHLHQPALRLPRIRTPADQPQPLHHPKMMAIHADRASSQRAEVHHRRAGLRTHPIEALQPRPNLIRPVPLEKIKRQPSASLCNLLERSLQVDRLRFRKGHRPNRIFNLSNRSIPQILPASKPALKVPHYLKRDLRLSPRR
jgi:hypothetical protein